MPALDESFFRLSPDRVLQAVEAAGLRPTGHCTALNALENRVFDLRLEDGSHVVAKFYRPGRWSREAILDEHRMLSALREAEIPVCAPLVFPDGETLHEVEGIFHAVWPRTGGRSPDELSDAEVAVLGRLLARIHNVGAALEMPAPADSRRGTFRWRRSPCSKRASSCPRRAPTPIARPPWIWWRIYRDLSQGVALHPIHGDCHAGNLLRGPDAGWFFLDFDDMVTGPAVQDVWMLLPGRDAVAARQRSLLVDAYREFRDFDERSLRLVEPLRGFRFVWYAGWIAKRWSDPAFPDAFPHFGTEQYWANETRDLCEQVERIRRGESLVSDDPDRARPRAEEDEKELTNEDFFWDL